MLQVHRENYCLSPLIYLSNSARHYGPTFFWCATYNLSKKFAGHWLSYCLWNPCLFGEGILQAMNNYLFGGKDGAVVRALASHHCGLVQMCGLSLLFGSLPCSESFFLRFSRLLKNQHFQIPIRLGMVDEEPLCGCATAEKSLLFEKVCFIWVSMYSARKYFEDTIFTCPLFEDGTAILRSHRATRRPIRSQGKGITFISQLFKTLSIGSAPIIEPTTTTTFCCQALDRLS